jgi:ribonuclease-3
MSSERIADEHEHPGELAKRLNLPFDRDLLLLTRALTHRSYINEHPEALEDNERLEFLGDAVLDFMVGAYLYHHFPEMPEGDLTRMRSALVHTEKLAQFAMELKLGNAIRLGRGEEQAGGRNRVPILCDTFEAIIGAVYLAAGIDGVNRFIIPLLDPAAMDIITNHKIEDPKSRLQEWSQSHGLSTPVYNTRSISGPDHNKEFEVEVVINGQLYGMGRGHSKQQGAKQAAKQALNKIGLGQD